MLWVTAMSPISRLRVIGVRREGRTQMERPQRISRVPCFIREAVKHALPDRVKAGHPSADRWRCVYVSV